MTRRNAHALLDVRTLLASLAAGLLIVLSVGGVSIARAESPAAEPLFSEAGPLRSEAPPAALPVDLSELSKDPVSCSATGAPTLDVASVSAVVEGVRKHAEARAADPDAPRVLTLNRSGANYESGPTLDLGAFIELQRAGR